MAKFLVFLLCLILTKSHLIIAMSAPPTVASRKLGKQIRLSSAEAPTADESSGLSAEVSASGEETAPVGQEEEMKTNHHHRSIDKSVAGGGVILGGLATTFLVAIFCYIRATRRRRAVEPASPTHSDSSVQRKNGDPTPSLNK